MRTVERQHGPLLGGRYRLDDEVGSGGMARVVRAFDVDLERPVAVKLLRSDLVEDADSRGRFEREARAVARLSHPNIVPVYDVGEDDGVPYFVMPLVDGPTLRDELKARGQLPTTEALSIAQQIATALSAAHQAGVIHRDVKPENILLAADEARPNDRQARRALLADFGIARLIDDDRRTTAQLFGTAEYVAPERAEGQAATPASDLYSLGVVFFEMLAGAVPFHAETPLAMMKAHAGNSPPSLTALNPAVPASLTAIVDRLLAKDPSRRPSANELAIELRRLEDSSAAATGALGPSHGTRKLTTIMERPVGGSAERAASRRLPLLIAGFAAAALLTLCSAAALASRWPELSASLAAASEPPPEAPAETPAEAPAPTAVPAVAVPNVLGKREAEARSALAAAGLHVGPARSIPAAQAPANLRNACVGCVVGIQPETGANVPPGSEVTIVVRAPDSAPPHDDDNGPGRGNGRGNGRR